MLTSFRLIGVNGTDLPDLVRAFRGVSRGMLGRMRFVTGVVVTNTGCGRPKRIAGFRRTSRGRIVDGRKNGFAVLLRSEVGPNRKLGVA